RSVNWQPGDGISLECLVRMHAADGTLMEPAAFLPVAERFRIMPRIDRWVLETALDMIVEAVFSAAQVDYFSINLSGQSMSDGQFIDFALDLLQRTEVDPGRLTFEITETSALTNFGLASHLIRYCAAWAAILRWMI